MYTVFIIVLWDRWRTCAVDIWNQSTNNKMTTVMLRQFLNTNKKPIAAKAVRTVGLLSEIAVEHADDSYSRLG